MAVQLLRRPGEVGAKLLVTGLRQGRACRLDA